MSTIPSHSDRSEHKCSITRSKEKKIASGPVAKQRKCKNKKQNKKRKE